MIWISDVFYILNPLKYFSSEITQEIDWDGNIFEKSLVSAKMLLFSNMLEDQFLDKVVVRTFLSDQF